MFVMAARISAPGSDTVGARRLTRAPMCSPASGTSSAADFLVRCVRRLVVRCGGSKVSRQQVRVRCVSSAAISDTSRRMRSARAVMSSRLLISGNDAERAGHQERAFATIGGSRWPCFPNRCPPLRLTTLAHLHETQSLFHATPDGIHAHDDLLKTRALRGRKPSRELCRDIQATLDDIHPRSVVPIEKLEQLMVSSNLRARMFENEEVRTWERNPQATTPT